MAHVTGGGLAANLARVLPPTVSARVDRSTWQPQPVFTLLAELGQLEPRELEATFNMGVGMTAVVATEAVGEALDTLAGHDVPSWVCGQVHTDSVATVTLHGSYA